MGQKRNPVSLRLQFTNRHFDNCWYSQYFYKSLVAKDIFLQQYFNNFLKLLKLSEGRYSIQHLPKKTQVYNFFCYSKSTREWRSQIFGLSKNQNSIKKSRYFSKNFTEFKKGAKKLPKLNLFYINLNQIEVFRIQKRITSFQNLSLWSSLGNLKNFSIVDWNRFSLIPYSKENSLNYTKLLKKVPQSNKLETLRFSPFSLANLEARLEKKNCNLDLLFIQNLLIYKILKSSLKRQKNSLTKSNFSVNDFLQLTAEDSKYKNYLESSLTKFYNFQFDLVPFKVKNDWQYASYLADEIVYFLEKRIPFRRLKNKLLRQLSQIPQIRGIRITCSGRVGGKSKKAQRAKIECIKFGQTSLQVFSSKIDFAVKTAFTSFGSVGVKVWICYN